MQIFVGSRSKNLLFFLYFVLTFGGLPQAGLLALPFIWKTAVQLYEKTVNRRTAPPLSFKPMLAAVVLSFVICRCQRCCVCWVVCREKIKKEGKENFYRGGKGQALLQTLVCVSALCGLQMCLSLCFGISIFALLPANKL